MEDSNSSFEPVQVFIRVRPESVGDHESLSKSFSRNGGQECITLIDNKTMKLTPPDGQQMQRRSVPAIDDKIYSFDHIFDQNCSQEDIYQKMGQHVRATIRGYNTTIFALGCTGSGNIFRLSTCALH
jgi:hypothetical protein